MEIQIGIVSALIGILITVLTFSRNRDKDVKTDATESAVVRTKLDNINNGVESIRIDIKANEKRVADLNERVIRVEESAKQAHKRMDSLELKGEIER